MSGFYDEVDEFGADRSDWDDLGTLSDQEGWESGMADAADWGDDGWDEPEWD